MTRDEMVQSLSWGQRIRYQMALMLYWIALKFSAIGEYFLCSCIEDPLGRKVFKALLAQSREPAPTKYIEDGARAFPKELN